MTEEDRDCRLERGCIKENQILLPCVNVTSLSRTSTGAHPPGGSICTHVHTMFAKLAAREDVDLQASDMKDVVNC